MGRKLADIAGMHDELSFQGIALHTIQQGVITAMHIGLLGTMSQLALADIRAWSGPHFDRTVGATVRA